MIISHKHKYIFIHNPFAGGRYIESVLLSQVHFLDFVSITEKNPLVADMKKDPEWIYLNFDLRDKINPAAKSAEVRELINKSEFLGNWEDYFSFGFIRHPLDRCLEILTNQLQKEVDISESQKSWFYDGEKKLVNFIGKVETLQDDLNTVLEKLQLKPTKNHFSYQVTDWQKFFKEYDKNTLMIFSNDKKLGGYKFDF